MTDEKLLIDRARRGEMDAFRELVERSRIIVYRMAYDLTGNRHDAEDLSQEAYVRAYRALAGFRGGAKWTTWLYRIMVNLSRDQWRKEARRPLEYSEDPEEKMKSISGDGNDGADSPVRSAEGGIIQEHINRALQALSPQERKVFVLRHYEHFQLKEIAEMLEVAEGTVKSSLFRAIRTLQKELAFYRPELGADENI